MAKALATLEIKAKGIKNLKRTGDEAEKAGKKMGKFRRALNKTGGAFKRLGGVIKSHPLLAGAGIAAAIGSSIKAFADYEKGLAKVSTLTKDTDFVFGAMSDTIAKLSRQYGISRGEFTTSAFDMVSAGIELSKTNELLAASAALATAGFSELSVANNALITVMQIYKDEVRGAADAADFLFKVQEGGRTTVEGVANVFGQFASTAKSLEVDLNVLGASFSALTQTAVGNEKVATQLRALFTAFSKPAAKDAIETAAKYGVTLDSSAIAGEGLVDVVGKLRVASTKEMAIMFKETLAREAMINLIQFESKLREEMINIKNRSGAVALAEAKAMDTTSKKIDKTMQDLASMRIAFGEVFSPLLDGISAISNLVEIALLSIQKIWHTTKMLFSDLGTYLGEAGLLYQKTAQMAFPLLYLFKGTRGEWEEANKQVFDIETRMAGAYTSLSKVPPPMQLTKRQPLISESTEKVEVGGVMVSASVSKVIEKMSAGMTFEGKLLDLKRQYNEELGKEEKNYGNIANIIKEALALDKQRKRVVEEISIINAQTNLSAVDRLGKMIDAVEGLSKKTVMGRRGNVNAQQALLRDYGDMRLRGGMTLGGALQKTEGISGFERFRAGSFKRTLQRTDLPSSYRANIAEKLSEARMGMMGKATTTGEQAFQFRGAFDAMEQATLESGLAAQAEISDRKEMLAWTRRGVIAAEVMRDKLTALEQNNQAKGPSSRIVTSEL